MSRHTLIGLALAALAALVVAFVLERGNSPASDTAATQGWLAPALRGHVNEVSRVLIKGAGDKTLATLQRGEKGWTLAEKGGYAIDSGKLRDLLLKLAEARLVEQKTANKDKYAALGVQDIGDAKAKGVLVQVEGLAQPLAIIIGDSNPRGGSYVRLAGDAQSWLTGAAFTIDRDPAGWLRKELASIPAARIATVTLERGDGVKVRLAKKAEGDANFSLADVPKGREAGDAYLLDSIGGTLDGLRMDDVLPVQDAAPATDARKARFETFDGVVVDVTAWPHAGKHRAVFAASLDTDQAGKGIAAAQAKAKAEYEKALAEAPKPGAADKSATPANDVPVKPLAESDPVKDRANRLAALEQEVARLNASFNGWTFVIPAYKYANLDKSLADLLKPVEAKAAADGKKGPGKR